MNPQTDMFGQMIFILNKNHHEYLNNKFKKYNLNVIQGIILIKMNEDNSITQQEIGERFSLSKGTIAKYLSDLEEKKYIKRERMENNKRKYILTLDEKSEEIIPQLHKISKEWENKTNLNNFNPTFLEDFKKLVHNSEKILKKKVNK